MDINQIIVAVVLIFIIFSLYKEWIGPAFTFFVAIIILGLTGILTSKEILSGFANEQIAVITLLLLLGDIIRRTSFIEYFFDKTFKSSLSKTSFLFRMTVVVASLSAFFNNTPLVAIMMPHVSAWSQKNNISSSKFLIPLSYAAILGGTITLIGTSTNMIVNGLVIDQKIFPEIKHLNIFDFAYVGIPMMIIGILYLVFFSNKLLPDNKSNVEKFNQDAHHYMVEAHIRKNSDLIGKTIENTQLRNLKGLFLAGVLRNNQLFKAIPPNTILQENDILFFAGKTETVANLVKTQKGLTFPEVGLLTRKPNTDIIEIVITHNSSMISKTVKEANFRGKYDAAIIGIQRDGEHIQEKIGSIKLKAGDVLLLLANDTLFQRNDILDFYFISKVKELRKTEPYKTTILVGGTILAIILASLGIISLFLALTTLFSIVLLLKIASPKDIYKNIDYNLILIIAMSLALGIAMVKTGLAENISHLILHFLLPFGVVAVLTGIYIITALLAAYVTNKAAVAIVFPISLTLAADLSLEPMPFILVVAFAAAANFMTPIGYQTNLMVYGPGSYKFKDFFKIGFPLTILYMIVTISILYFMYFHS